MKMNFATKITFKNAILKSHNFIAKNSSNIDKNGKKI
jgi:hypothetical protein